jgi:hypothetical protein
MHGTKHSVRQLDGRIHAIQGGGARIPIFCVETELSGGEYFLGRSGGLC